LNKRYQQYQGITIAKSNIHGKGVFADDPIPCDHYIGDYTGPKSNKDDDPYVLWVEQDDGSYKGTKGTGQLRFLNHSSEPNAEFDGVELYALRDIEPGEEVTIHYGDEWED